MLRMFWRDGRIKAKALQLVLLTVVFLFFLSSSVFGETTPEKDPALTALQQSAKTYWKNSQYAEAEDAYNSIVVQYPSTDQAFSALKNIALLQITQEKWSDVDASISKLDTDFPNHTGFPQALNRIAEKYIKYKQYDKAESFFHRVVSDYPLSDSALQSQAGLIRLYICDKAEGDPQVATDKLAEDYSSNSELPASLIKIAKAYKIQKKFVEAKGLYTRVVTDHPNAEVTSEAQMGIKETHALLEKQRIASLVKSKDFDSAQAAANQLCLDSAGYSDLPNILNFIARNLENENMPDRAKYLYEKVVAEFGNTDAALKARLESAKLGICSAIKSENYTVAESDTIKLSADFAGNAELPASLIKIAKAYKIQKKFVEAKGLYTRVVTDHPNAEVTSEAQMGIKETHALLEKQRIASLVKSKDFDSAQAAANQLCLDSAGYSDLPNILNFIARNLENENMPDRAKYLYEKVVAEFGNTDAALKARLESAKLGICSAIKSEDYTVAESDTIKLSADFADNSRRSYCLDYIADKFLKHKQYGKMRNVLLLISDSPDADINEKARMNLDGLDIITLVQSGREVEADAAIVKIKVDFSTVDALPTMLEHISRQYEEREQYEKAENLNKQIVQDYPGTEAALRSQTNLAKQYVIAGSDTEAQAATNKLASDFSGRARMAIKLRQIGKKHGDRRQRNFESAKSIYLEASSTHPTGKGALLARTDLINMYIMKQVDGDAGEEIDKLITDFGDDKELPNMLRKIATTYSKIGKYETAENIHTRISQLRPESIHSANASFDTSKTQVLSLIDSENYDGALVAVDKLMVDFNGHAELPETMKQIGLRYRLHKEYDKLHGICQRVLGRWPGTDIALWAQGGLAASLMAQEDESGADSAKDKLLSDFSAHKDAASTIFDLANNYYDFNRIDKARILYQYILDTWPNDQVAIWARAALDASVITSAANPDLAKAEIDSLFVDHSDTKFLSRAVIRVAWEHYKKGVDLSGQGQDVEAKIYFQQAADTAERVTSSRVPLTNIATAYCLAGDCYVAIEDYTKAHESFGNALRTQAYYKYAWHAQFMVGRCMESMKTAGTISPSQADPQIREAYTKVIELHPTSRNVDHAQEWLDNNTATN